MGLSELQTLVDTAWAIYTGNWQLSVPATYAVAEIIVRLTPTKTDDSLLERFGAGVKKFLDMVLVPNLKKK